MKQCKTCQKEIDDKWEQCYICHIKNKVELKSDGDEVQTEVASGIGEVSEYEEQKQIQILRGQCFNAASRVTAARCGPQNMPVLNPEFIAETTLKVAKALFEESKKQKFLQWR